MFCCVDRSRCRRAARSPDTRVCLDFPCAVCINRNNNLSYRIEPNQFCGLVQFGPAEPFFPSYAGCVEEMNSCSEGRRSGLLERNNGI